MVKMVVLMWKDQLRQLKENGVKASETIALLGEESIGYRRFQEQGEDARDLVKVNIEISEV